MTPATTRAPKATGANNGQPQDPLAQAIAYEQGIADEAAVIRGEQTELTPELFMALLPLLRKPIPQGFIVTTPKVEGKPYESTGIKSVQVQIDRMDNVLTPMWWWLHDSYEQEGKLCRATVYVAVGDDEPVYRVSYGGVNRGSTIGNLYKGSFTNAAKRALAMIGPGHEVYIGATDHDPDVDEDAAKEQAKAEPVANVPTIDGERVASLTDLAVAYVTAEDDQEEQKKRTKQITRLLRSEGLTGSIDSVTQGFARLTPGQGDNVEGWLREQKGGAE